MRPATARGVYWPTESVIFCSILSWPRTIVSATESPGDFDSAAPADEFGKQSSLDQAGIAQADINSWSTAPVIVEQANSQNTLNPDDLLPAWGGSQGSGT